jgi:hypothetical protein
MSQTARFQETLRKLAMIDEAFVEDQAGLRLGQAGNLALDPKTAALLQLGVSVATGSPAVCIEWSTGRALVAGATDDEIAVRPPPDARLHGRPWPHRAAGTDPRPKFRRAVQSATRRLRRLSFPVGA